METRLEKYKRRRKEKRIKRIKIIYVLILFVFLIIGLQIVNQRIVELYCLDSPYIFRVDIERNTIDILGKSYVNPLSFLKNLLKDQFLVF